MPEASTRASSTRYFITFEGGEGSGKSTQVERLAAELIAQGRNVVVTREPGGTAGANALRRIILTGAAEILGNDMEAILFAAARLDHLEMQIKPALRRGDIVLCDRFHDSTRVYQGGANGVDPEFMTILEEATLADAYPDLTILLDIPAKVGLQRAAHRRVGDDADRFEKEDVTLHEARRQEFLAIAQLEPDRCVVFDARASADEVAENVRWLVFERLGITGETGGEAILAASAIS